MTIPLYNNIQVVLFQLLGFGGRDMMSYYPLSPRISFQHHTFISVDARLLEIPPSRFSIFDGDTEAGNAVGMFHKDMR